MIPAAAETFGFDADLLLRFGFQQVQRDPVQPREVLGGVALADAAVVFPEGDVQRPVQAVLDSQWPRIRASIRAGSLASRLLI